MFTDISCTQEKKYNQAAFGDYFVSKRTSEKLIAVLSDGLGSGIKANILSCMTATMLLKFIDANSDIAKACEIVLNSLPVCQVRKISYSTFSALECTNDGAVKIVEEGNPDFIWISSDGIIKEAPFTTIKSKTFPDRKMKVYNIRLEPFDRLIFCSDGVTQAGLGGQKFKMGLERSGLIKFVQNKIKIEPDITTRELSKSIVDLAKTIDGNKATDDISACVVQFNKLRKLVIFTGPPYHNENDSKFVETFIKFNGKKAVCGGTTANIISRELKREIVSESPYNVGKLPACSSMEGVDLITEGILTLGAACEYLENETIISETNAATKLLDLIFNSDYILFMVGASINHAHWDPNLPIEIEIRKNVIKKMKRLLEEKYIKRVEIQYM